MNSSTHDITLNIHGHGSNVSVRAKRGDTGRVLRITLMDGRKPYTITEECRAVLTAKKEDGNILYNGCEIVGNTICYEFTPQTTSCAGRAKCEIKLYGADDKLLTSARFALLVEDTVYNEGDEVESEKEVSELTQLISRTAELTADIEKKLAENAYADAHSAVCFTPQDLMDSQKDQARRNIGAKPDTWMPTAQDVGARPNTWLPTIAEIGAAPAGYGLGMSGTSVADLNTALNCGFFAWGSGCANAPFSYGMGIALNRLNGRYTQLLFNPWMDGCGEIVVRHFDGTKWLPYEWLSPPMYLGKEYRTTERWNGKAVYVKTISCGNLPNTDTKIVAWTPDSGSCEYVVDYGGTTNGYGSLPNIIAEINLSVNYANILLKTNADRSSGTAIVWVKYTKV